MTAIYAETSAVLAWLLGEPLAADVRLTLDRADRVVTSVLTLVEAERGLVLAARSRRITEASRRRLRGFLGQARDEWTRFEISEDICARAVEAFPVEPVRTLDALHLSTALIASQWFPSLRVLSFDRRILTNAKALGISIT